MGSINLSNFPKFANKYYFLVVLENYHAQSAIVLLHETVVTKSGFYVTEMS
jgi:hypothetical protein